MKICVIAISFALLCLTAIGCTTRKAASPSDPSMRQVMGKITYLQKVAMPADAVVEVQIEDQDASAVVIGEQTIVNPGQVPVSFSIDYDPSRIDENHTYVVRAKIMSGGELLWQNTTSYPVITKGSPSSVEVVVQPTK